MSSSLSTEKPALINSLETLSQTVLSTGSREDLDAKHFVETLALLSSDGAQSTLSQSSVAVLLDMLSHEYAQVLQLQQKTQEILTLFTEVNTAIQLGLTSLQAKSSVSLPGADTHPAPAEAEQTSASPSFYAVCLGPFALYYQGTPVKLCSNCNGRTILRLLIAQPDHSVSVDTLLDLLWPEDPADMALRKLHVTLSNLRNKCSPSLKIILYQRGVYRLNPAMTLHSDVEKFLFYYQAGQKADKEVAISYFEKACSLYTRPFLLEDLYADWSFAQREQLRQIYLTMSSVLSSHYLALRSYDTAAHWALEIIKENSCNESAHRQLMRIYALQGRRNDALRQYRHCQRILREELNLEPLPETETLQQAILQGNLALIDPSED